MIVESTHSSAAADESIPLAAEVHTGRTWPPFNVESKQHSNITDISRDEESVNAESIEGSVKRFDGSSWPCSEQCSRSQSPLSYVVQLNEDSECSLQSLPPGETRHIGFNMALSSTRHAALPSRQVEEMASEMIEDDSQCGKDSERGDDMELMLEVEIGSNQSELSTGVVDGGALTTSVTPASGVGASAEKSRATSQSLRKKAISSAAKSRIRKRLSAVVATETTATGLVLN